MSERERIARLMALTSEMPMHWARACADVALAEIAASKERAAGIRLQLISIDDQDPPRDGREFLALCVSRGPWSPRPEYTWDIAKWSGTHYASRSGNLVTAWLGLPDGTTK